MPTGVRSKMRSGYGCKVEKVVQKKGEGRALGTESAVSASSGGGEQ